MALVQELYTIFKVSAKNAPRDRVLTSVISAKKKLPEEIESSKELNRIVYESS